MKKQCTKCLEIKALKEFYKHPNGTHGRNSKCKECAKEYARERRKDPEVAKHLSEYDRTRKKSPKVVTRNNERKRDRSKTDKNFMASRSLRAALDRVIRRFGIVKKKKSHAMVGYGADKLAQRLECQFLHGMGWHNRKDWHIDHKKPVQAFLDQGISDPAIVNALCNLQPIWAVDNIAKGAKWRSPANDNTPVNKDFAAFTTPANDNKQEASIARAA